MEDAITTAILETHEDKTITADDLVISMINTSGDWVFGIVGIRMSQDVHGSPSSYLYITQFVEGNWIVATEDSSLFQLWVTESPDDLLGTDIRVNLQSRFEEPVGNTLSLLSLPYATGETWTFSGGPHNTLGNPSRPWSAIDFAGGSTQVRTAREGTAYLPCANLVRIDHPDGWRTEYYHLQNIAVSNGQAVSRGTFLGNISTAVGCGGSATGPHVHFTLILNGSPQEWHEHFIGGWRVQEGSVQYQGCMIKNGNTRCTPTGQIYNDGAIGGGGSCCGCSLTNQNRSSDVTTSSPLLPFAGLIPQGPTTIAPPPTVTTAPPPPSQELPTAVTNPTTSRPPDFTAPTGSLQINSGGEIVNSLNATLRLDAQDENRVAAMRFSTDGRTWTAWQPFTTQSNWQLANQPDAQTVYAQVKDEAGNISQEMMSTVTAVLSVDPPTSASYTVACSVMGMGGGTASSGSYTVNSTIGQPYATTPLQGSSYQVHPGFETACSGENVAPISHETYVPFVIRP
jgi:LasA protease